MKEYRCPKCNSKNLFIKKVGNNTGLYCGDCGAWIKWVGKNELRAFEYLTRQKHVDDANSKQDDIASIIYGNLDHMYCDNCRFSSEIKESDSDEWNCDECHRKYNGWEISMQESNRIAKEILKQLGE
jgi:ribosomal protein L37AE/L43A